MSTGNGAGPLSKRAEIACHIHKNSVSSLRKKKGLTEFTYVNTATVAHALGLSLRHFERLRRKEPMLQGVRIGYRTILYDIDHVMWAYCRRTWMQFMKERLKDGLELRPKRQQEHLLDETFRKVLGKVIAMRFQLLQGCWALEPYFLSRKWQFRIEKANAALTVRAFRPAEWATFRHDLAVTFKNCTCRDKEGRQWKLWARATIAAFDEEIGRIRMKPTYDDLVALLRAAPPRQMIEDERYWIWRKKVEEVLARIDDA